MKLVNYQGQPLSEDTAIALQTLAAQLSAERVVLRILRIDGSGPLSLVPAGRHVRMEAVPTGDLTPQYALEVLWAKALPLGFSPWARFPVLGEPGDQVFHFFGPWRNIQEHLVGEGRGELAWPSLCAVAQCEVDTWEGGSADIRLVQGHLHRLGQNPGAVDGIMGTRTQEALRRVGLDGQSFDAIKVFLPDARVGDGKGDVTAGHLVLPGRMVEVSTFGFVKAQAHAHGAAILVDGPGRLVVDVR
jgi:hypothetical protein